MRMREIEMDINSSSTEDCRLLGTKSRRNRRMREIWREIWIEILRMRRFRRDFCAAILCIWCHPYWKGFSLQMDDVSVFVNGVCWVGKQPIHLNGSGKASGKFKRYGTAICTLVVLSKLASFWRGEIEEEESACTRLLNTVCSMIMVRN